MALEDFPAEHSILPVERERERERERELVFYGTSTAKVISEKFIIIIIIVVVYRPLSMLRTGWTFSPNQAPPTLSLQCPLFL